jgi:hypothetical protein
MISQDIELLPCPNPWCESHEHGAVPKLPDDLWTIDGSNAVRIGCPSCEMLGPHRSTEGEAIAAWQTRISSSETETRGLPVEAGELMQRIETFVAARRKDRVLPPLWQDAINLLNEARSLLSRPVATPPTEGVESKGVPGDLMSSYRHWAHGIEKDVCAVDLTEEEVEDLAAHLVTALASHVSPTGCSMCGEMRKALEIARYFIDNEPALDHRCPGPGCLKCKRRLEAYFAVDAALSRTSESGEVATPSHKTSEGEVEAVAQVRLQAWNDAVEAAAKVAESDSLILSESRKDGTFGKTRADHGKLIAKVIRTLTPPQQGSRG